MVKVLVLLVVYHISLCAKLTGVSFRYKRGIGVDPKRGDLPLERAREPRETSLPPNPSQGVTRIS